MINTVVSVAFAIAAYNIYTKGLIAIEANFSIIILGILLIFLFAVYIVLLKDLEKQSETLNVKLEFNLNEDIVLKKDEKFKIIFEKDDKGHLMIKKG